MSRIEQIAEAATTHVPTLILGMADRIEAAITDAVEAAQEADTKATLRIPVAIVWDIDSRDVRIAATVATRCKAEVSVSLDDPGQGKLALDEGGIPPGAKAAVDGIVDTLRTEGATVTTNRRLDA